MAKLDSLIIDLQLNTAELRKGLDEANRKLGDFGNKLNDLAGVITFDKIGRMAWDATQKIVGFALGGAQLADAAGKMAQSVGVSVESFTQLSYAANLSGVGTEDFAGALNKLNGNIAEAAAGGREQVALFNALGVSVKDSSGKVKGADVVFKELSEKFAGMEGGASKARLANEFFGKQLGAQLIPMMNLGKSGLSSMAEEANRFGVTISGPTAAAAESFNDNVEKIKKALGGVAVSAAAQLAPALANLSDQFLKSKDSGETLKTLSETLSYLLKLIASAAVIVGAALNQMGQSLARVAAAAAAAFEGEFKRAFEILKTAPGDSLTNWESLKSKLSAIWDSTAAKAEETGKKTAKVIDADAAKAAAEKAKKAAQEYEQAVKRLGGVLDGLNQQIASFGGDSVALMEARLTVGDLADDLAKAGDKAEAFRKAIIAAAQELQDMKLIQEDFQIHLNRKREDTNLDATLSRRGNEYFEASNLGRNKTFDEYFAKATKGFENFTDALNTLSAETKKSAHLLDDAQMALNRGQLEEANQLQILADQHGRVAEKAGEAVKAFEDAARRTADAADEMKSKVSASMQMIAGQLASKMGDLGNVIQAGVSGWKTGGWWAALMAVGVELLSRFKRFGEIIEFGTSQVSSIIDQLAPAFSVLIDALKSVMTFSGVVTKATIQSLEPVIKIIARVIDTIFKTLTPIAAAFQQIGEAIGPFVDGLLAFGDSLGIMDGAIKMISGVFNLLSVGILFIVNGFLKAWSGVLTGVRDFIKFFGANTAELDKTIAANAAAIEKNQQHMDNTMRNLLDPNANAEGAPHGVGTFDTPTFTVPMTELGDAAGKAADNLNKFSASLTNVPEGFRYNQRWFEAQSTDNGTGPTGNTTTGNGYVPPPTQIVINGNLIAEKDLVTFIKNLMARENFRTTGIGLISNSR